MSKHPITNLPPTNSQQDKLGDAILGLVLQVPASSEHQVQAPEMRAYAVARSAARQASLLAGSLALPPGILGWLTVLPELVGVWKLQSQMVSDIAALFGKSATLGREQMIYCLFKHVSAQLARDLVVQVGERYLVQASSLAFMQTVARTLGIKATQRIMGKSAARLVPLLGVIGVSAYAYFDTMQVAQTAIKLFAGEITLQADVPD